MNELCEAFVEAISISIAQVKIQRLREVESLFQNNPADTGSKD